MVGAGIAVGPAASAALAAVASWRTIYWVVGALSALLMPLARIVTESRRAPSNRRLDMAGMLIFAGAMGCLTTGLTLGRQSWTQPGTVALLLGAGSLLAVSSRRAARAHPLLALALSRGRCSSLRQAARCSPGSRSSRR